MHEPSPFLICVPMPSSLSPRPTQIDLWHLPPMNVCRRSMLAWLAVLSLAFANARALADEQADETPPAGSTVVARIGEAPIFRAQLDTVLRQIGFDRASGPEQQRLMQAEAVEQTVNEQLLRLEIERDTISVREDEVTAIVDRLRSQLASRKSTLEAFLSESGQDEKSLRKRIEFEIGLNKLIAPRLTSDAIAALYAKEHREYDGTQVRASHIVLRPDPGLGDDALLAMLRRAEAIRREILQGTISFADAAKKYSAGPSRRRGGDIGFFPRHGVMADAFGKEAFGIAKASISKPFVTPFGVHIVMVTAIQPGTIGIDALRPLLEKIVTKQIIREILSRARTSTVISYSAGVPHFDPTPSLGDPSTRKIIVGAP